MLLYRLTFNRSTPVDISSIEACTSFVNKVTASDTGDCEQPIGCLRPSMQAGIIVGLTLPSPNDPLFLRVTRLSQRHALRQGSTII